MTPTRNKSGSEYERRVIDVSMAIVTNEADYETQSLVCWVDRSDCGFSFPPARWPIAGKTHAKSISRRTPPHASRAIYAGSPELHQARQST